MTKKIANCYGIPKLVVADLAGEEGLFVVSSVSLW